MSIYPSSQAHTNTLLIGSCKIEYSNDAGVTWTNLGLARGVTWKENIAKTSIQADNASDISNRIGEQTVDIGLQSLELYLPTLYQLRGIDTYAAVTAARTTDTDVQTTGSWSRNKLYYFENQGYSSALSTLPSVVNIHCVNAAGNATDTLNSTADYHVFTDADGRKGIIVLSTSVGGGDTGLTTRSLRVRYNYKSITSYKLKSGGLTTLNTKWYKLTNKEIIGGVAKYRYWTIYSGTIEEGLNFAFKSCNEADAILEIPMTIKAKIDPTRSAGDQLFVIEDEAVHV